MPWDGAPPHWHHLVRDWLNDVTDCWIGRHAPDDRVYLQWPSRSPDLIPCDVFLWSFVKDQVYVAPLPANLPELRDRIREAVAVITPDMLIEVWEELAYREKAESDALAGLKVIEISPATSKIPTRSVHSL
ncbi:hypothetical protein ANN_16593 [Periplaneta americana]|uniref:Uncharacterized protein n=1 Tax=Periplaneta americana TaxID=6978 RepID=A0ABQ8SS61_PERAM|nr:hypothetical protein ANN_16593 [Periplaneta americana]